LRARGYCPLKTKKKRGNMSQARIPRGKRTALELGLPGEGDLKSIDLYRVPTVKKGGAPREPMGSSSRLLIEKNNQTAGEAFTGTKTTLLEWDTWGASGLSNKKQSGEEGSDREK